MDQNGAKFLEGRGKNKWEDLTMSLDKKSSSQSFTIRPGMHTENQIGSILISYELKCLLMPMYSLSTSIYQKSATK